MSRAATITILRGLSCETLSVNFAFMPQNLPPIGPLHSQLLCKTIEILVNLLERPVVISKSFNKGGSRCNYAHILGVT